MLVLSTAFIILKNKNVTVSLDLNKIMGNVNVLLANNIINYLENVSRDVQRKMRLGLQDDVIVKQEKLEIQKVFVILHVVYLKKG